MIVKVFEEYVATYNNVNKKKKLLWRRPIPLSPGNGRILFFTWFFFKKVKNIRLEQTL